MKPRQANPTVKRRDRKGMEFEARAPYNFIPLPEQFVPARAPLDHDRYYPGGLTGWFECRLTTQSPTYIRGMLRLPDFKEWGEKSSDQLNEEQRELKAEFFSYHGSREAPVIPGSSLRGMLRSLVEIIGFGRMRWVAAEPSFTFRAVAASKDNPLREPYNRVLGSFGANVRAGYLKKDGKFWYIQPALAPSRLKIDEPKSYCPVKEPIIQARQIPGFKRFNDVGNYEPGYYPVTFTLGKVGNNTLVKEVGGPEAGLTYRGCLVSSGNMLENEQAAAKEGKGVRPAASPRKKHSLVLERDPQASRLPVDPDAIDAYKDGMTEFQKEKAWQGNNNRGVLKDGAPVFYIEPQDSPKRVRYFGHSPNFRIPAFLQGQKRASTPLDFVPNDLKSDPQPDMADAMFGWVEEKGQGPKEQRAGRVFVGDAALDGKQDDIWMDTITPHVLGGPKPTTYQHYLTQDKSKGHDPDRKETLAHYGVSPAETQVRGAKFYWIKGANPPLEANDKEKKHPKQLTRIKPLKPGVKFAFKIHFENLHPEELGALAWALGLPGREGLHYCHRIGMGKPLGMGAIHLEANLHLSDRQERYQQLFSGPSWNMAQKPADTAPYVHDFQSFILERISINEPLVQGVKKAEHLVDLERIDALLTMLEWREGDAQWLDWTRYMEIEHVIGVDRDGKETTVNEYKELPVLPTPQGVVRRARQGSAGAAMPPAAPAPATSRPVDRPHPAGVGPEDRHAARADEGAGEGRGDDRLP